MQKLLALTALLMTLSGCVYVYEVELPARRIDAVDRIENVRYRTAPRGTAAAQLGAMLNETRRARGLGRMSYNSRLSAVAQAHAENMARRGFFSHRAPDGSTPHVRVKRAGYPTCLSAENIAKGQDTVQEVFRDWMASSGHRANKLNPNLREYGVGYVAGSDHWVMVFASPGC